MDIYSFIIGNKEIFKLIYALIIIFVCFVIVLKTHRLFHLSAHPGIRYFRNAFFFYGIAFFIRYVLVLATGHVFLITPLFEFFIIMAGFFLLYSLIWKKIEGKEGSRSSLFSLRILIFYVMALILVILDISWSTLYLMFFSQIILFFIAAVISCVNYKNRAKSNNFSGFYFIAMILMLAAWILNSLTPTLFDWNPTALINIYLLNAIFFLVFLYGAVRITKY